MAQFFYEVLVGSPQYHGNSPLTYHADQKLSPGQLVSVSLQQRLVLAIVKGKLPKPTFKTKPISEVWPVKPLPTTSFELISWLQDYYRSPMGVTVQYFLPKKLTLKTLEKAAVVNIRPKTANLPPLSSEQSQVLSQIKQNGSYILHGETGSGKTRVYQEVAARTLKSGRSVLVLTPEISLTSQLQATFQQQFGEQVVVVHSHLTEAQRRTTWLKILSSKDPLVIIGARSALFSPRGDFGAIIVDEAHEPAYKQDQSPRYNAIRVASKLGEIDQALVILGSATPSVVDYFVAEQKHVPILRMRNSAVQQNKEQLSTTVIDLKDREQFKRSSLLSDALVSDLGKALEHNEQSLLFLNRRGTARIIICQNCGWQALCPRCDLPLVYHADNHTMRCHTCNYRQTSIVNCPVCQSPNITFKSIGTKAVATEINRLFPDARVQRFDTDNLTDERFETHYDSIKAGDVDVLVGTQAIAKGLDLPNLSVVGVVMADTSLSIPDFSSSERMYQLLRQVIGRVARGHRQGSVVIQTFSPDNPILLAAVSKDWQSFYEREIEERRKFMFPPFCYLLKLSCRRKTSAGAEKAALILAKSLSDQHLRIELNGPTPSFHTKSAGLFEWELIIKSKQRADLVQIVDGIPSGWSFDLDPSNLL